MNQLAQTLFIDISLREILTGIHVVVHVDGVNTSVN
jgi:hypothetical protein